MQLFLETCYTRVRKGKINERQCAYKSTVVWCTGQDNCVDSKKVC